MTVLRTYLTNARVSRTQQGTVRHYHVHVAREPEREFFHHGHPDRTPLLDYYHKFV
jgi:hypothetical protein